MRRLLQRAPRRAMIAVKSSPYLIGVCGILAIIILLSLRSSPEASDTASQKWSHSSKLGSSSSLSNHNYETATWDRLKIDITSEIGRSSNSTLGFEKVFVLGLKERSDKKDAMLLSASLTGFQVEFVDAVKGEEVLDKVRPPGLDLSGPVLGSWRSHLNVIRSIVENNLASAFIMEDDVDWDIRLLSQLPEFAKGVRFVSEIPPKKAQHSPYGDDWDVLWPGHCGDVLPENDNRKYMIQQDETVAPKTQQGWLKALADYPEKTRIVHRAGAPICTFGYAVSYRGAQKILFALGIKAGSNLAIDNSLAYLCRDGFLDMKCFSVEPQLFQHHRPAGSVSKDSDINGGADPNVVREKGFTEMIVWSARLNLEQLIKGSTDYVMQW
ncbi:lps glycosyltransferase [Phlyctema vagabunda]|uniref:Lps glycosyltransferase n=1 Tax=Phlyctema vagabunda TaxID=108571 RepID=A0ABR4P3H1_9HELO